MTGGNERSPFIRTFGIDSIKRRAKERVKRTVGNKMFWASAGFAFADVGRTLYSATLIGRKDVNPVLDTVVHHVGDFTWFSFAELLFHQGIFRGIKNPNTRRNASIGGGLGLLAMAEVPEINHFITGLIHLPILGTPDLIGDAPAGIVGLAAWYLVRTGLEKFYTKKYEAETQREIQEREVSMNEFTRNLQRIRQERMRELGLMQDSTNFDDSGSPEI